MCIRDSPKGKMSQEFGITSYTYPGWSGLGSPTAYKREARLFLGPREITIQVERNEPAKDRSNHSLAFMHDLETTLDLLPPHITWDALGKSSGTSSSSAPAHAGAP